MVTLDDRTNQLKNMIGQKSVSVSLNEDDILAIAPTMPSAMVDRLSKASREYSWGYSDGINDKVIFERKYEYIAKRMYMESGTTVMERFMEMKPLVEASALHVMNEGDVVGNFRGSKARGGNQFDIKALTSETFGMTPGGKIQSTGGSGDYQIISQTGPTDDEEVWVILGYSQTTNPEVVESFREKIDDEDGVRHPYAVWEQMNFTDLPFIAREEPGIIFSDQNYELRISATQDADTDFFPVGVSIATHDVIDSNSTIASGSFT